jgi:hypothetical protein
MVFKHSLLLLAALAAVEGTKKVPNVQVGRVNTEKHNSKLKQERLEQLSRDNAYIKQALHSQALEPRHISVKERRQAPGELSYNDVGTVCANSANNIDNFRCFSDADCYYYESLRDIKAPNFDSRRTLWAAGVSQWNCQDNRCKAIPVKKPEMSHCTSGALELSNFQE